MSSSPICKRHRKGNGYPCSVCERQRLLARVRFDYAVNPHYLEVDLENLRSAAGRGAYSYRDQLRSTLVTLESVLRGLDALDPEADPRLNVEAGVNVDIDSSEVGVLKADTRTLAPDADSLHVVGVEDLEGNRTADLGGEVNSIFDQVDGSVGDDAEVLPVKVHDPSHESSPYVADAGPACSVDPANIVGGATDTAPCVGAVGAREHAAPADTSSRIATVFSEGGSWALQGFDAADLISSALIVLDKEMNRRWALGEQVLSTLGPRLQRIKALGENHKRIGESRPADVEFVVDVLAALLGALDADSTLLKNLSDLLRCSLHHCSPVPSGPGATNTGVPRDLTVPEAADFPVVGPRRGST